MIRRWAALLLAATLLAAAPVPAAEEGEGPEGMRQFETKAQEARYYELLGQLRCLVCQNQSLASSDADLAKDLRDEVYNQLVDKGKSNEAIIDYLVARYGDFVLYRPPFQPSTYLLWVGPFLLLVIGFAVLATVVRRRNRAAETAISDAERARVAELLETESDEDNRA
jgi:cytochrome c-type biogenesis protein CcmH